MMRSTACLLLGSLLATEAFAQVAPFDMSQEREAYPQPPGVTVRTPPAGAPSTTPVQPAPPAATPIPPAPASPQQTAPTQAAAPAGPDATSVAATTTPLAMADVTGTRRYLIPFREFILEGETQRRSWSVFLTAEEAASARQIHSAYQNAVVVAPELSKFRLLINDVAVFDIPIQSSDQVTDLVANLPAGLLKSGANTIVVESAMRHRTDCTIQSTYELWTEVDPGRTFLTFDPATSVSKRRVDDIQATGVDQNGRTRFAIVAPGLDSAVANVPIVRLAEGLALSANMPNLDINVYRSAQQPVGAGGLTVVVGTAQELAGVLDKVPDAVSTSAFVGFVDDAATGPSTLVVGGPTWTVIESAVESIVNPVDRPATSLRAAISTKNWRLPDAPLYREGGSATFADLGVPTQEFTGRRLRTEFAFGIPSDFYANDYGEATLLLDAAFSPEVLPGSHIDVYVNGNIASTLPITQSGGGILRQLPISVTMRHLKPGANLVRIEAILMTESDAICTPGTTASTNPRFVIFETSRLEVPNFARIARSPDLAALAGTGFPYNRATDPLPLIVERNEPGALSAAAAMLARMSVAAGRALRVDGSLSPAMVTGRNAIFVSSIANTPAEILRHFGISPNSQSEWAQTSRPAAETAPAADTTATFDRWRQQLSGSGWRGRVSSLEDWLARNFDFTIGSLIKTSDPTDYMPKQGASIMVAQQESIGAGGTWTLVTAPSGQQLDSGMQALGKFDNWNRIGGRITTIDGQSDDIAVVPVASFRFIPTQPASIANYRLIAANWLSSNVLAFAGWLVGLCTFLGLVTAGLLSILGRRG
jgi:hypothetical protein